MGVLFAAGGPSPPHEASFPSVVKNECQMAGPVGSQFTFRFNEISAHKKRAVSRQNVCRLPKQSGSHNMPLLHRYRYPVTNRQNCAIDFLMCRHQAVELLNWRDEVPPPSVQIDHRAFVQTLGFSLLPLGVAASLMRKTDALESGGGSHLQKGVSHPSLTSSRNTRAEPIGFGGVGGI
jgi:hypothetical protein